MKSFDNICEIISRGKNKFSIKEFLKSSIIGRYIYSLLGVGYDSKSDQALIIILVFSSLLLSIASGYTTISGLTEYFPFIISFLIGIGVQGLLFTTSFRIGKSLLDKKFKLSLFIIYFVTLLTSVFFSYSAILNKIYTTSNRKLDEFKKAKTLAYLIEKELLEEIIFEKETVSTDLINSLFSVNNSIKKYYEKTMEDKFDERLALQGKYTKAKSMYEKEVESGITVFTDSLGIETTSIKGEGILAKKYWIEMEKIKHEEFYKIDKQVQSLENTYSDLSDSYKVLTNNSDSLNFLKYNAYTELYTQLTSELQLFSKDNFQNDTKLQAINEKIMHLNRLNKFFFWINENYKFEGLDNAIDVSKKIEDLITNYPNKGNIDMENILKKVSTINKFGGDNIHYFVLAIGSLFRDKIPIAYGCLSIALVIDLLILFCGLVGARNDSILKMKDAEGLYDSQQGLIETLMSLDINKFKNDDNFYIRRIVSLISAIQPSTTKSTIGFAGHIKQSDIERLGLHREFSLFHQLDLAKKGTKDDNIYIRTRLLLWLSEQVVNYENQIKSYKDINNIIKKI